MKQQTAMWTACPNGVRASQLLVSVFVSHHLWTDEGMPTPSLGQFPDVLNWPNRNISFDVVFEDPETRRTVIAKADPDPQSPSGDARMWQALFNGSTYVRPYKPDDYSKRTLQSFSVKGVHDRLSDRYSAIIAKSGDSHPSIDTVLDKDQGLGLIAETEDSTFNAANSFHEPWTTLLDSVPPPDLDFHNMASSLGDFPQIMRRVRLVYDLVVPLQPNIPTSGMVHVVPHWAPSDFSTDVASRTLYELHPPSFAARARDQALTPGGWLALGNTDVFHAVEVDIDGAAIKVANFAQGLERVKRNEATSEDTPTEAPLPSLRSGGISVAWIGRSASVKDHFRTVAALQEHVQAAVTNARTAGRDPIQFALGPPLFAEDITRGYRIDIFHGERNRWFSLCERVGRYRFPREQVDVTLEDEGWIALGATQAPTTDPADSTAALRIHEFLFTWTGWSLAVPRPGRALDRQGRPARTASTTPAGVSLETDFTPKPGTLPPLRFGVQYKMRARVVDLAGNSVLFTSDGAGTANTETNPLTFTRFQPVPSPVLITRNDTERGESLARIVIRSNYNKAASVFVPPGISERHFAPPSTSEATAEAQKSLDDPSTGHLRRDDAYELIVKSQGTLPEIDKGATVVVPYLADPLARSVAIRGLPGLDPSDVRLFPFTGTWPRMQGCRILLEEGKQSAWQWDAGKRVLSVQLRKGEQTVLKVSSAFSETTDLESLGIWKWLRQWLNGQNKSSADLQKLASDGALWALTPYREVRLVHAVQQPLLDPEYDHLSASRSKGNTYALLNDVFAIDGKSTSKFEVVADWDEQRDDPSSPKVESLHTTVRPVEVKLEPSATHVHLSDQRHEFGDTKYRRVDYRGVATTRFAEYFPEDASPLTRPAQPGDAIPVVLDVPNSARPDAPQIRYVLPVFDWEKETHQTDSGQPAKWVSKRYGNRLRIYMERPWYSSGDDELLGVVYSDHQMTNIPDELKPYVTQWGADPVHKSGTVHPRVAQEHFNDAVEHTDGLSLDELPTDTFPQAFVSVAGHKPVFDPARNLWRADLRIDAGPAHHPFVRLALARYQPHSLEDCHLSRIVLAQFVQLPDDRVASVIRDPRDDKKLTIMVSGLTYRTLVDIEAGSPRPVGPQLKTVLQGRPSTADINLAWQQVVDNGKPVDTLMSVSEQGDTFVATGTLNLPTGSGSGTVYRVLLMEDTVYASQLTPRPHLYTVATYLDTIELPANT